MQHKPDQAYDKIVDMATDALARLLAGRAKNGDVATECKVRVLQFGTNLLYLPVYLLLSDIEKCWNEKMQGRDCCQVLKLTYKNYERDVLVAQAVKDADHWQRKNVNELTIGISELRDSSPDKILEYRFIKRLPLWGVALSNNPKINLLKNGIGYEKSIHGVQNPGMGRAVRHRYWSLFSGKLSLLSPSDLLDDRLRLGVSLYQSGTTAHRLFVDDFIGERDGALSFTSEVTFENEFDDLFRGIVDVALTVQPWQAVRKAEKMGCNLEVVYVHQGRPAPFASIYCKRPDDESERAFLKSVLRILRFGVQENVARLYDMDETAIDTYLAVLKNTESEANKAGGAKTAIDTEFGVGDMSCALHLLSDSRIYYYDTANMLGNSESNRNSKLVTLGAALNAEADCWDEVQKDPISTLTWLVAQVPDLGKHANEKVKLSKLLGEHSGHIQKIEKIVNALNISKEDRYNENMTGKDLCDKWRLLTLDKELAMMKKCRVKSVKDGDVFWNENSWRSTGDFTPWFPRGMVKKAFEHFDLQFRPKSGHRNWYTGGERGVLLLSDNAGYAWAWIRYKNDTVIRNLDFVNKSNFKKDRTANWLLHGWYISPEAQFEPDLFFDRGHSLKLKRVGGAVTLSHGSIGKLELNLDKDEHGFLFTFSVFKKGSRQT